MASLPRRASVATRILIKVLLAVVLVVSPLLMLRGTAQPPSITFVQGNASVPQTPQTVVTVPFTEAQSTGNLNVVVVGWNDSTAQVESVTDTKGNAYVKAIGPTAYIGAATQSIYYAANIAAAAADENTVRVMFTTPSIFPDIRVAEYRGLDRMSPVDVAISAIGSDEMSDSGAITTTNANDLLVGANLVLTSTAGSGEGYTPRLLTEPDGDILEDRVVSSTGNYSATAGLRSAGPWIMQMVAFRAATVATTAAILTYPANGTLNADLTQPFRWTSVALAQAYYLYVGSTPGAKDIVNTGEIQQTSYSVATFPSGQTVYARLWTKVGGVWRYTDSTFSTAPLVSTLTYPANGAVNADLTQPIRWTSIPLAQAYYLYVGSTPGAKDIVNTGEIQQTSYTVATPPSGQTVYARLWTKVGGVWRYTDSTFSTAPLVSILTYPANGAINADLSQPIRWTTIALAQAYSLYVGSTAGAKDLVSTGETQQTSYRVPPLPGGQTVYARLWTKVAGVWRYSDSSFGTAPWPTTYTVSGTIIPATAGAGATVWLTGGAARTTIADYAGKYAFSGLPNGTYTIAPSSAGRTFMPASWNVTVNGADITGVSFSTLGPTKDRANSYDDGWKTAWVNHARVLLATTGKTSGFVLEIGDSITHSFAYAAWPLQGQGATAEDTQAIAWAGGTSWGAGNADVANKNGWYLASADTTSQRGMTSSSGLSVGELLAGCCNFGPDMPVATNSLTARQIVRDSTYTGNLQIDTVISAFTDAQFAVVMLGTNDTGNPSALADLTAIVDRLEAQHIVPILSTIPPRSDAFFNQLTIEFNAAVVDLARTRSLPLIDFYQEIVLRRPGTTWFNTLISTDGVHPTTSRAGYSTDSDPYAPGGDAATHTTGDSVTNVGYLLRSWLTVQKLKEMKLYVIDGVNPLF